MRKRCTRSDPHTCTLGRHLDPPRAVRLAENDFQRRLRRFFSKVSFTETCWVWVASRDAHGYGQFHVGQGVRMLAHRWVFEVIRSEIPSGMEIDHLCRNRSCVNPAHLEAVTHRENCRRGLLGGHAQRSRTHCPFGHPYSGENLYIRRCGSRACRECDRTRSRERQRRYRLAARAE